VKSEGRNQANHRARDGSCGNRQVMVLRRPRAGRKPISPWSNLFEGTRPCHSGQRASVDALTSYVPGPQNGLLLRKSEKSADTASTSRRFAYTH
jgi:hypothetical protein